MGPDPRVGKITIETVDVSEAIRFIRNNDVNLFIAGGAKVFNITCGGIMLIAGEPSQENKGHPDDRIALDLNSFRKQRVVYSENEWLTRDQIIKFVANVSEGVHSGTPEKDFEHVATNLRAKLTFRPTENSDGEELVTLAITYAAPSVKIVPAGYNPHEISAVLFELLSTITFLVNSEDVQRLVSFVSGELNEDEIS
jgi:hypothetical protein